MELAWTASWTPTATMTTAGSRMFLSAVILKTLPRPRFSFQHLQLRRQSLHQQLLAPLLKEQQAPLLKEQQPLLQGVRLRWPSPPRFRCIDSFVFRSPRELPWLRRNPANAHALQMLTSCFCVVADELCRKLLPMRRCDARHLHHVHHR